MEDKNLSYIASEFELGDMSTLDQYQRSIVKVIGVGGGGINAANQMFFHIKDINFAVLDSDSQQLNESPIPDRVLLESIPGHDARYVTEENEAEIATLFDDDTKWAIIVAGMGGETGTDVASVVARIAREKEVALTVGIVTIPFRFEGPQKILKALKGVEEMSKHVDALFIFNNQHLTEIFNDLNQTNAFAKSDETLTTAVRGLYDIISVKNKICIDFNDLNYTLHKGGNSIFFSGYAVGERRVTKALEDAFASPLLKDCDIYSSRKMMMNFYYNPDSESPLLMEEMNEVQAFMSNFDQDTDIIWGIAYDNTLEDQLKVTVLASGFNTTHGQYLASLLQDKSNQ